jgi:hypothetical protein
MPRPKNSTQSRTRSDLSLSKLRSAISNGSSLLVGVDERSVWCRRLRDLVNDAISDLGGRDMVSSAEMILVRRASMLALQCEMMETRWAQNEGEASAKQIETYQRVTGALRRTLESLGLRRRARDVTPSLQEYIASKSFEEADA